VVADTIGEHHNPCLPHTREKVLNSIREWAQDPTSPQVLWLTDVAGSGKSTIAKHLSDEWRKEGRLGGCFFFDKNRPETTSTRRFCETIAYQMATSRPHQPYLRSAVLRGIRNLDSAPPFSPFIEKLQKIVVEPLRGLDPILVIDALDECDKGERGIMLRKLLPSLPLASLAKVFITSRPEPDLVQCLSSYQSKTDSLHDIRLQSNQADIWIYVEDQMRSLVQSSILTHRDVELLAKRVNCLFILASTACKAIQDSLDPSTMLDLLLNSKFNPLYDINNLYGTILERACGIPQVRGNMSSLGRITIVKVLKAILVAVTPLDVATIDSLLGIKNTKHVVGALSSVLSLTVDGPVLILHPTFREFLEDEEVSGNFHVDLADAHKRMAKRCLAIMKAQLQFNICRIESSFYFNKYIRNLKERVSKFVSNELQYGSTFWSDHIISSSSSPDQEVNAAIRDIVMDEYPLYWMEVMSALERIPKALANLQDLKSGPLVSVQLKLPLILLTNLEVGFIKG
jgi:hypothetical protein